jgi:hypothetical protein
MSLGKQAKTLSKGQIEATLGYLAKGRPQSQGNCLSVLGNDHRWEWRDRLVGRRRFSVLAAVLTDMSLRHCVDPVRLSAADPEILNRGVRI